MSGMKALIAVGMLCVATAGFGQTADVGRITVANDWLLTFALQYRGSVYGTALGPGPEIWDALTAQPKTEAAANGYAVTLGTGWGLLGGGLAFGFLGILLQGLGNFDSPEPSVIRAGQVTAVAGAVAMALSPLVLTWAGIQLRTTVAEYDRLIP